MGPFNVVDFFETLYVHAVVLVHQVIFRELLVLLELLFPLFLAAGKTHAVRMPLDHRKAGAS
jgi:hypothetical protein